MWGVNTPEEQSNMCFYIMNFLPCSWKEVVHRTKMSQIFRDVCKLIWFPLANIQRYWKKWIFLLYITKVQKGYYILVTTFKITPTKLIAFKLFFDITLGNGYSVVVVILHIKKESATYMRNNLLYTKGAIILWWNQ